MGSCQETAVRMVGVTYRSNSARPNNAASKFVFPAAAQAQDSAARRGPAPSFKDKESYNELFKPLPKPDPAPSFAPIKFEAKSWKQLQEERESLMTSQLEKTKCEAMELWNRAKTDDQQRIKLLLHQCQRVQECDQRQAGLLQGECGGEVPVLLEQHLPMRNSASKRIFEALDEEQQEAGMHPA